MGCCNSGTKQQEDNAYEKKQNDANSNKIIFLGSSGAGKTTLWKQLRTVHGDGFFDKDRVKYKPHIYSQIIEQMKSLYEYYKKLSKDSPDEFGHLRLSQAGENAAQYIEYLRNDADVDEDVAKNVEILWKEHAIKAVFQNRAKLKIYDSTSYFFDAVRRIAIRSYIPTDRDVSLVYCKTSTVVDQQCEIQGSLWHVFDVGGRRSERKKWVHSYENVAAVIFVASLSCYDEVMIEDESQNAMLDSIVLFGEICSLRWFIQSSIILFLNKKDLFRQKIQTVSLSVCFDEYDGMDDYVECVSFIKEQFKKRNSNSDKQIYIHCTCATDRQNIRVYEDVQTIVVSESLARTNLLK